MEVSGQLHAPDALLPGKEPLVATGKEVESTPEPVWTLWSREKSFALAWNRMLAVHPVAIVRQLTIGLQGIYLFICNS
jgi:hypothetical protein